MLTQLNLSGQQIDHNHVQYLTAELHNNTVICGCFIFLSHFNILLLTQTLKNLSLAMNTIGDEGATYLANALQNNTVCFILPSHFYIHFYAYRHSSS